MTDAEILAKVKSALGITGDFQDDTLQVYIADVKGFMLAAGVDSDTVQSDAAVGCISRGVADLWNYGSGNAKLSTYFLQKMLQLRTTGGSGGGGSHGKDGFSPTILVEEIDGGHRLTITDVDGTRVVDVMDGADGKDGKDGEKGADGNDYVLTDDDKADIASLVDAKSPIYLTVDDSDDPATTSKTGEEIYALFQAGYDVHLIAAYSFGAFIDYKYTGYNPWAKVAVFSVTASINGAAESLVLTVNESKEVSGEQVLLAAKSDLPKRLTDLQNDAGYITFADVPQELPAVTAADSGKFLRVVAGTWAAATVPDAESGVF